jgi:arylformamidase
VARSRKARQLSEPIVYNGYTQAELNRQYDTSGVVPPAETYFAEWAAASERARAALRCDLDLAYGEGERERLDFFPATKPTAPCLFWIHGGYWRRLDKSFSSFVAEPVVAAGGAVAIVNYPLVATATLDEIVAAVRRAFAWTAHNAHRLNADPRRMIAGGHSAGGQLAGMLAATRWSSYGLPAGIVRGVFALSGLFDLEPVRRSHVNEWLNVDVETARRNSPLLLAPERPIPLFAAAGGDESFEFKKQSRDYVETCAALGYPARYLEAIGHNHFSIVGELAKTETPLTRALLDLLP